MTLIRLRPRQRSLRSGHRAKKKFDKQIPQRVLIKDPLVLAMGQTGTLPLLSEVDGTEQEKTSSPSVDVSPDAPVRLGKKN